METPPHSGLRQTESGSSMSTGSSANHPPRAGLLHVLTPESGHALPEFPDDTDIDLPTGMQTLTAAGDYMAEILGVSHARPVSANQGLLVPPVAVPGSSQTLPATPSTPQPVTTFGTTTPAAVSATSSERDSAGAPGESPQGSLPQSPVVSSASHTFIFGAQPPVTVPRDLPPPSTAVVPPARIDTADGEALSAEARPDISSILNPVYPEPSVVIGDAEAVSRFEASGLLEVLSQLPARLVTSLCEQQIGFGGTSCLLDPYDQIVMGVTGRYYSNLPQAGVDPPTLRLIHLTYVYTTMNGVQLDDSYMDIRNVYLTLTNEGLGMIAHILARLMMPPEVRDNANSLTSMNPTEYGTVIEELRDIYPEAIVAYNMIFQLVHGGVECIAPIHDLCRSDNELSLYVNSIARGGSFLRMADVQIPSRPAEMQTVPTATQTTHTAPPVMIPARTPVAEPRAESSRAAAPSQGLLFRGPQPQRPTQLLPQGAPTGMTVIRDTTAFRESVTVDDELRRMSIEIRDNTNRLIQSQAVIITNLERIESRLSQVESAMAAVVVHGAQRDLADRTNINRTLLQPQAAEAQVQMSSILPRAPPAADGTAPLIRRIEGFTALTADPTLPADLSSFYRTIGDVNAADNVTAQSFASAMSRRRMLNRLRTISPA